MKTTALLLSAVVLFLLGGCASMSSGTGPMAQNSIDYEKIYLVEQWARRNNADVMWVNYPVKKAADTTTQ
jgi:uncharacterized protein YceK